MRRQRSLWTFLLLLLAAACGRDPTSAPPRVPGAPSFAISDGANGGNRNFFLLPPLVPSPAGSPNYRAGQFNARLTPTVEICKLPVVDVNPADGRCDSGVVARWGVSAVRLSVADELYQVNWKTDSVALAVNAPYRIRVLVGDRELGFVDVVRAKDQLKNQQTGANIVLGAGRTLPIKFRIQNGALVGAGSNDYAERTVPATGGTDNVVITKNRVSTTVAGTFVKTANGQAGAFFPNGWLPPGVASVVVTIERVPVPPGASCHGVTGLVEFEGCYAYNTYPRLPFRGQGAPPYSQFYKPVTVQMCTTLPDEDPRYDGLSLFKSGTGEPLTVLPEVDPAFFLDCDNFRPTPPATGLRAERAGALTKLAAAWRAAAGAAWDGLAAALTPPSLYAVDLGAGGETLSFSNIGFGIRQSVQPVGPTDLTPAAGATAPPLARVRVVTQHDHAANGVLTPPEYIGVPNVQVTFSVTAGGGTVPNGGLPGGAAGTMATVVSDAGGYASVPWTLGAAGANALTATVMGGVALPYAGAPTVTFTATVTPPAPSAPAVTIGGLVRDQAGGATIPSALTATLTLTDGTGASRNVQYVGGTTGALDDALRSDVPADAAFLGKQALLTITFPSGDLTQTRTALVNVPQAPGSVSQNFTVTPRSVTITGTVTQRDQRTPVGGVLVRVGPGSGTTSAVAAVTNAQGAYALYLQNGDAAVTPGTFSFFAADRPGYVTLRNVYAPITPGQNQTANLSLLEDGAPGVLAQAQVRSNGTPAVGVNIVVRPDTLSSTPNIPGLSAVTDQSGRFRVFIPFGTVPAGNYIWYGPQSGTSQPFLAGQPMPATAAYLTTGFSY